VLTKINFKIGELIVIKAIIFDFDGVLVESTEIKTKSFGKLFESEGNDIVQKVIDYHLGNSGVSRFEKIKYIYKYILQRQLTDKTFNDKCRIFSELVFKEVVSAPFVPGAKEFLDNYSNAYKFFVCSATPQKEIERILRKRDMKNYFKHVYGSPNKKEDIVKMVLQNNVLLPNETAYIGDSLSDYKAANANSVKFIARIVNNENSFNEVFDCIKITDLLNLKEILNKI